MGVSRADVFMHCALHSKSRTKRKPWRFTPSSARDKKEDMGAMADLAHILKSLDQDNVKVLALSIIP